MQKLITSDYNMVMHDCVLPLWKIIMWEQLLEFSPGVVQQKYFPWSNFVFAAGRLHVHVLHGKLVLAKHMVAYKIKVLHAWWEWLASFTTNRLLIFEYACCHNCSNQNFLLKDQFWLCQYELLLLPVAWVANSKCMMHMCLDPMLYSSTVVFRVSGGILNALKYSCI